MGIVHFVRENERLLEISQPLLGGVHNKTDKTKILTKDLERFA